MKNLALGMVTGLIIGLLGSWAYTTWLGAGQNLAEANKQLLASQKQNADLQGQLKEAEHWKTEAENLKLSNDSLKQAAAAAESKPSPESAITTMTKMAISGQYDQKLSLWKERLHLTLDQEAQVKAALDQDAAQTVQITEEMFQGGKVDPPAWKGGAKSAESVLEGLLDADQKTAYQQLKGEQKNTQAETMATYEMNQVSPMLQLTEDQKDQVLSTLYQTTLDSQNPDWIKQNVPSSGDPSATLDAIARAKETALAKILSPQQLEIYHNQVQSQLVQQKAMMQKFMNPAK